MGGWVAVAVGLNCILGRGGAVEEFVGSEAGFLLTAKEVDGGFPAAPSAEGGASGFFTWVLTGLNSVPGKGGAVERSGILEGSVMAWIGGWAC